VSRSGEVKSSDCKAIKSRSADQWALGPPCHPRLLPYRELDAPCETRWLRAQKKLTPWQSQRTE